MFTIHKNLTYALVGATNDSDKYGNIVFHDLQQAQYKVIPINIHEDHIDGYQSYHTLKEIPQAVDVVIFVVPPLVTEQVLNEVKELSIKKVWMQPGASSTDAITFCEQNNIDCIHDVCIMISKLK